MILKYIPGYLTGYLFKTKGYMSMGNLADAASSIQKVLEFDSKNEDAYILHALILTKQQNYFAAINSLQQAIANNFMIRENPQFMLVIQI